MKKKNTMVWVLVLIIVVVLALGVYAVYGTFAENFASKKLAEATARVQSGEASVSELADVQGMSVEELLESYGITAEDDIDGKNSMMEMAAKLSLEKYCEFVGMEFNEEDFAAYKAANQLGDDVTKESKDEEVKTGYLMYEYQKQMEAASAEPAAADAE